MRVEFIAILVFMICCKPKIKNDTAQIIKIDSTITESKSELKNESFDDFFNKFKVDSIFQRERIDKPLSVIISEEDSEEEVMQEVNYVSFNAKDWDMEISIRTEAFSKDSMNVILDGNDTGVHLEHLFALRGGKWYLFQIKNLSD